MAGKAKDTEPAAAAVVTTRDDGGVGVLGPNELADLERQAEVNAAMERFAQETRDQQAAQRDAVDAARRKRDAK